MSDDSVDTSGVDSTVPHSARVWNYWLGGKDNYEVDRAAGDAVAAQTPEIVEIARDTRAFLQRAVLYLVTEAGVRQFLDIGTGLPTVTNTHEVAQAAAPDARIVYVDNDPLVLAHARALLTSTPDGATQYIDADMQRPDAVLQDAAALLDFTRPVGLLLLAVLGHVADDDDARQLVDALIAGLPPGSYVTICDTVRAEETIAGAEAYNESGAVPYTLRSAAELRRLFDGLELVDPGFGPVGAWHPELLRGGTVIGQHARPLPMNLGGVARKS